MIRKNRLQCWALRMKNGKLVGRPDKDWFEAYNTITFRTRKAALLYLGAMQYLEGSTVVKIHIETYALDY